MRLLLVRHGESVCGVNGIVGGERGCTGLTERGFAQARALSDRLGREGFRADALFASTLPRAGQTAEVIGECLGLEVVRDPELVEHIPGEIDGTPWESWARFDVEVEPERPLSPGGESVTVFRGRIRGVLDRLAREHSGRTVVAVCHGGVVYSSLESLIGPGHPGETEWAEFTSLTEWSRHDGRWTLERYNDVEYLDGTDLLPARA